MTPHKQASAKPRTTCGFTLRCRDGMSWLQLPGRCLVIDGSRLPLAKLDPFLHDCFSPPQPLIIAPESCAVIESTFANCYTKTIQSIGSQTFACLGDVAIPSAHLPLITTRRICTNSCQVRYFFLLWLSCCIYDVAMILKDSSI
jgi:hypothetical protein